MHSEGEELKFWLWLMAIGIALLAIGITPVESIKACHASHCLQACTALHQAVQTNKSRCECRSSKGEVLQLWRD